MCISVGIMNLDWMSYNVINSDYVIANQKIETGIGNEMITELTNDIFTYSGHNIQSEYVERGGNFSASHGEIVQCVAMISEGEIIMDPMRIRNIRKLEEIAKLPKNWNDNGAKVFDKALIDMCKSIIAFLPQQPEIFPTAADSIQMEYEKETGEYLEFNVSIQNISIFNVDADDNETEYNIDLSEQEKLKKIVSDFYA